MAQKNTYILSAALSFLFPYLILSFGYFPSFGLSLSLIIFALFTYKYVKKGPDTKLFLALSLVFSSLLFIRVEPLVTFFNFWAAICFGILMLTSIEQPKSFLGYLFLPVSLFFKSLLTKSKYYLNNKNTNLKKFKIGESASGLIITFFVLAVILPLLASSNPIFENLLNNIFSVFNIFNFENLMMWVIRLIISFMLLLLIPKLLTSVEKGSGHNLSQILKPQPVNLLIPKLATFLVLIIFFITQIQLYFSSNLSYSQTTREVFGQLSIVAVVVFVLMYNSLLKTKLSQTLNWLLGIEGIFLALMAYKSVFEYIAAHGLTHKRLYGIVFATLVSGVFILYKIYFQNPKLNFARSVILFSAAMLLLVNLTNFDYLIYHFNKPSVDREADYTYLATLSPDSLSYAEQFELLHNATFNESQDNYQNSYPLALLYKIEFLQNKYSSFDLREFNLLEYIQYTKIKNLDTSEVREYYEYRP